MSNNIKTLINSDTMRDQFAKALPSHLSPERFVRIATTALSKIPRLLDCTPESMMKCLLDCSSLGLEPDGRRAYLIPYGKEATLIISYMGLIELMRRSGEITSIRAETVCEADEFSWENGEITHKVDWRKSRGDVQAVYAIATMTSGETQSATMTKDEVEAIRKRSKSANTGPWVTDWAEMAKKTCVRRLAKMLPLSSEIMDKVTKDDDQYSMRDITPRATANPLTLKPSEPEPIEAKVELWDDSDKKEGA